MVVGGKLTNRAAQDALRPDKAVICIPIFDRHTCLELSVNRRSRLLKNQDLFLAGIVYQSFLGA